MKRIDRFDPSAFRSQVAAQVDDFEPLDFMDARAVRGLDRFSQFGLAAGRMAMEDAGLVPGRRRTRPTASASASTSAPRWAASRSRRRSTRSTSTAACGPSPPPSRSPCSAALRRRTWASRWTSAGRSCPPRTPARSGAVAIGEALNAIRAGEIDAAIAGGVEVPLSPLAFGAFDLIRALGHGYNDDPAHASRPMDAARDGFVMGEGAALLVLESLDGAQARGARIYAEVLGYAATSDAHHMVQPRADGREAGRAVTIALADAGVAADEIDWVSAHASSTPIGDIAEARAIAASLGERARHGPRERDQGPHRSPARRDRRASRPSMAALAVHDGWVPGTVNLEAPEPELAALLPGLLREGRDGRYDRVLSTSFGFGGLNAALVLGSVDAVVARPRAPAAERYPRRMSDTTSQPAWERRFRAPILSFPSWAADAPDRLVMASTESGTYQLHAWDRATGARRQVTFDPVGVLDGRPTADGQRRRLVPRRDGRRDGLVRARAVRRGRRARAAGRGRARGLDGGASRSVGRGRSSA